MTETTRSTMLLHSSRRRQEVKRVAQLIRSAGYFGADFLGFLRTASLSPFDSSYDQVAARIMYNVHALEKGLAQSTGWQPGRGKKALRRLNDSMMVYRDRGYDEASFEFTQGISIIERYLHRHLEIGASVEFVSDVVDSSLLQPASISAGMPAGVKVLDTWKDRSRAQDFYALVRRRASVREFTGAAIDHDSVVAAIENASRTPSACNRQAWRVYWTSDHDLAAQVLHHQRGFNYKQMPEVLLAITATRSAFLSPVERNQGFVDGGMFCMTLLYGLEAEGLGAVPLNACLYMRARNEVKRLLAIPAAEELIMFVAIGAAPERAVVPVSARRPVGDFVRYR